MSTVLTTILLEPTVLGANTFYWKPSPSASSRRSREIRNRNQVEEYLLSLGFEHDPDGGFKYVVNGGYKGKAVYVNFKYSESCSNVYKSLTVMWGDNNSNITTIRKIHAEKIANNG